MFSLWVWFLMAAGAFGAIVLFVRIVSPRISVTHDDHDFLAPSQSIVGGIYGVLLAFVVVVSWQNYATLNESMQNESIGLLELWRETRYFEDDQQQKLQKAIVDYVDSIKSYEWPLMKHGASVLDNHVYRNLWDSVNNIVPNTDVQKDFLSHVISELEDINKARRLRLFAVESHIPDILWVFLITVAVYLISVTILYEKAHIRLRILIAALQSFIIVFAFYLISNFNHPFQGILEVSGEKMEIVTDLILKDRGDSRL